MGTMSGGSATIRSSPSTLAAWRVSTRTLSRVRALTTDFCTVAASFLPTCPFRSSSATCSSSRPASRCSYQTSSVPAAAASRMRSTVRVHARDDHCAAIGAGKAAGATHHLEAGGQAFDVPLPRSGEGLVEVVDVEQQLPFGRAEEPEIREVRVAAELHGDAGSRSAAEVEGHDRRRPSIERERRHQHAPVADREQLGHPARALRLQHRDRVGAIRRGRESRVPPPRGFAARDLPARDPLRDGEALPPPRRRERAIRGVGGTHRPTVRVLRLRICAWN